MIKFGIAKVCFTPKIGTKLFGQPIQIETDDKYNDLYARSFYLNSNNKDLLIISCDLLVLPKGITDSIRTKISKKTGVNFNNILIHTTHTHAGPVVSDIFNERTTNPKTQKKIINSIIDSGIKSLQNQISGEIGIGKEHLYGISFNRRYIMKDGTVEMHPHKDDPNLFASEGPNDPELTSIILFNNKKNPIGVLANFPCHLTSLERNNSKFSADFPYYAEEDLRKKLNNDDFVMLFLNGPCGNLCQVDVENRETFEVGDQYSRSMGIKFSEAVNRTINDCVFLDNNIDIDLVYKEIKIPIRKITEKMLEEAKEIAKKYKGKEIKKFKLSNYGLESYKDTKVISTRKLLDTDYWKNMSNNEILHLSESYNKLEIVPLTVAKLGGVLVISVPAELFVEYSIYLKNKFKEKYKNIIVIELVNGWIGYVPTKKAFLYNSGYEVQFLSSSKLCKNAGDIITDKIIQMEKKL
jgi:hypothetical protein